MHEFLNETPTEMKKALLNSGLMTLGTHIKKIQKTMEGVSLKVTEDENDEHEESEKEDQKEEQKEE